MMKKSVIIVIVLFLSLNAFCQSKDSIKLKNLEYLFIMCSQERQLINYTGYQFNNQVDSLNSCLEESCYETEVDSIYLIQKCNLFGQLKEQGYAIKKIEPRYFLWFKLKPKSYYFKEIGTWLFYDNDGNVSPCPSRRF